MKLVPDRWRSAPNRQLTWNMVSFPPPNRSDVPDEPGVYAFVIDPGKFSITSANALFYIGKATSLYSRIGYYLGQIGKEFRDSDRPKVWFMLNNWNGFFKYYYTTTDTPALAKQLEDEMLSAFLPPFNTQYDAATSQIIRAFP